MQDPTKGPAAPAAPGPGGAPQGSQMARQYDEFSKMPTPDPKTFLQLLWNSGILGEVQKEMITAMLKNPAAAGAAPAPGGAVPPAAPASPMGGPAGAPVAPAAKISGV